MKNYTMSDCDLIITTIILIVIIAIMAVVTNI